LILFWTSKLLSPGLPIPSGLSICLTAQGPIFIFKVVHLTQPIIIIAIYDNNSILPFALEFRPFAGNWEGRK